MRAGVKQDPWIRPHVFPTEKEDIGDDRGRRLGNFTVAVTTAVNGTSQVKSTV